MPLPAHDDEPTPLRKAVRSLYDFFGVDRCPGGRHYVHSVGEAADKIVVFLVREPMHFEKQVPGEWEGFPVEKRAF